MELLKHKYSANAEWLQKFRDDPVELLVASDRWREAVVETFHAIVADGRPKYPEGLCSLTSLLLLWCDRERPNIDLTILQEVDTSLREHLGDKSLERRSGGLRPMPTAAMIESRIDRAIQLLDRLEAVENSMLMQKQGEEEQEELPKSGSDDAIVVHGVAISKGSEFLCLTAASGASVSGDGDTEMVLRLFAVNVARGAPAEVVPHALLNEVMGDGAELAGEKVAGPNLRKLIQKLNCRLTQHLGRPPEGSGWIVAEKGKGYALNHNVTWTVEDEHLVRELCRRFASVSAAPTDPGIMGRHTPRKEDSLPGRARLPGIDHGSFDDSGDGNEPD